eukprot:2806307-Prymnesium_polylepis.1
MLGDGPRRAAPSRPEHEPSKPGPAKPGPRGGIPPPPRGCDGSRRVSSSAGEPSSCSVPSLPHPPYDNRKRVATADQLPAPSGGGIKKNARPRELQLPAEAEPSGGSRRNSQGYASSSLTPLMAGMHPPSQVAVSAGGFDRASVPSEAVPANTVEDASNVRVSVRIKPTSLDATRACVHPSAEGIVMQGVVHDGFHSIVAGGCT